MKRFVYRGEETRLDKALVAALGESRGYWQKALKSGLVHVGGKPAKASQIITDGAVITYAPLPQGEPILTAEPLELSIIKETADYIFIDKPVGLVVHPAPGNRTHTLVNGLLHYTQALSARDTQRPGIVHRLDKATSGILVACKSDRAHHYLAGEFAARRVGRVYFAVVRGYIEHKFGKIDAPLGRSPQNRQKMAVVAAGKEAVSNFEVLSYGDNCTLLKVSLETGRTHQIRVHMAYIGHPVVGDPVYGGGKAPRLMLHAYELTFTNYDGEQFTVSAPLPAEFSALLPAA